MTWFVLFLCVVVVLLCIKCRFLERNIELLQKQNERIQNHMAKQNEQLERFKNSFDFLSERFAYKPHFKKEQLKVEQIRIDVRDFFDFYYARLDEKSKDEFLLNVYPIELEGFLRNVPVKSRIEPDDDYPLID